MPPDRLPVCLAAGNPVTAEVGAHILRSGGSAADAAVAMVLTSCAAETIFTGLGGGGFATYYDAAADVTTCLDFFVTVPGLGGQRQVSSRAITIDFGAQVVPYSVGPATAAVPGVPAGVEAMHQRWGRLPWRELVAPAISHAERGVALAAPHAKLLVTVAEAMLLGEGRTAYSRDGVVLSAGSQVFHPGLDQALRTLADDGSAAFYTGEIGEAIVAAVGDQGLLTAADLAAYRVRESSPRSAHLGDVTVLARGDDLDDLLGTLDVVQLDPDPATMAVRLVTALRAVPRDGDTTSVAVSDDAGNACAVSTSLGLASGVWVPGYGIHLNSMLGEGELLRHDLSPGDRMTSMMSPLIGLRDERPVVAAGAAGGSRIRSALLQVLVNVVQHGMSAQQAVTAPRLNPVPGKVHVEPGLPDDVLQALQRTDEVVHWPALDTYFGGVSAVHVSGAGGDPRRGGDVRALSMR
jgi:gamma-glutamyltranspeptidase / glutathione hydrolase